MPKGQRTELAIACAETDADLEAMIRVRRRVTPEARPTVETLRFNLESSQQLVYSSGASATSRSHAASSSHGP